MKLVKTASGKTRIKMSHSEWIKIGERAGWLDNQSLEETIKKYVGDRLRDGKSDDMSIDEFPMEAIKKGIKVEREHTNDMNVALEIVLDHLEEDSRYYDALAEMEDKLKNSKE